jgi:beta-phosphoglucomutase
MNTICKDALPHVETVLFDMDGVLIDSIQAIEAAWQQGAALFDRVISKAEFQEHVHGQPGTQTLAKLFGDISEADRARLKQYVDLQEETQPSPLQEGARQLVDALHELNVPIGLVTSSWRERVRFILHHHKLISDFSTIVTREDVASGKPASDPYILARRMCNCTSAAAIEDSHSGVRSAAAAGCFTLALVNSKSAKQAELFLSVGAHCAVPDLTSITPIPDQHCHGVRLSIVPFPARTRTIH